MIFIMTTNQLIECLIILFISAYAFAQVNSPCRLNSGQEGTCKETYNCPSLEDDARRGIVPQRCSSFSQFNIPIVCCPKDISFEPNDNTFLNRPATEGDFDAIIYPEEFQTLSVSENKCKEYSRNSTGSVEAIPLVIDTKPVSLNYVKCEYNGIALIVGGEPASAGEFPFMAALGYPSTGREKYSWRCGGTLISDRYVLSAAHCTSREAPEVVRLGDLDLSKEDDGSIYADYGITKIVNHPRYRYSNKPRPHDIALILLNERVEFTQFIRPACLYTNSYITRPEAIATGYGATSYGGPASDKLLKVSLNIYNGSVCSETFKNEFFGKTMLCAGETAGGRDACGGDSGGPLVITPDGNQCKFYIIGVTSFGKGCGVVAGVYTKVSEYISWIENIVWQS